MHTHHAFLSGLNEGSWFSTSSPELVLLVFCILAINTSVVVFYYCFNSQFPKLWLNCSFFPPNNNQCWLPMTYYIKFSFNLDFKNWIKKWHHQDGNISKSLVTLLSFIRTTINNFSWRRHHWENSRTQVKAKIFPCNIETEVDNIKRLRGKAGCWPHCPSLGPVRHCTEWSLLGLQVHQWEKYSG